jgi:hypothetical protein
MDSVICTNGSYCYVHYQNGQRYLDKLKLRLRKLLKRKEPWTPILRPTGDRSSKAMRNRIPVCLLDSSTSEGLGCEAHSATGRHIPILEALGHHSVVKVDKIMTRVAPSHEW